MRPKEMAAIRPNLPFRTLKFHDDDDDENEYLLVSPPPLAFTMARTPSTTKLAVYN
jgi:hypothetical protein